MLNKILDLIAQYVDAPINTFNEDTNIFDLGVDSLRMLKIIMKIEEEYGIKFENQEIVDIRTAYDIEKIILKNLDN